MHDTTNHLRTANKDHLKSRKVVLIGIRLLLIYTSYEIDLLADDTTSRLGEVSPPSTVYLS